MNFKIIIFYSDIFDNHFCCFLFEIRRTFLALPATPLERTESLEQLRVLEHGHAIVCAIGEAHFTGIDTPEQYAAFVERVRAGER